MSSVENENFSTNWTIQYEQTNSQLPEGRLTDLQFFCNSRMFFFYYKTYNWTTQQIDSDLYKAKITMNGVIDVYKRQVSVNSYTIQNIKKEENMPELLAIFG